MSWPTTLASLLPMPRSQQEDTNEDKWLLYKVSISDSLLFRAGHAPPSTAFSMPSHFPLVKMMGQVKNPPLHTL